MQAARTTDRGSIDARSSCASRVEQGGNAVQEILQQFTGGGHNVADENLGGHVDSMVQQAPAEHVQGALGDALQTMGPQGFGQSVQQAAQTMNPQQQQGLFGMFSQAIQGGGGSVQEALGSSGAGGDAGGQGQGGGVNPGMLGTLAEHALANHGDSLTSVLGNNMGGGGAAGGMGGSGLMSMLGNPMARQFGSQLAQRMSGG